MSCLEAPLDMSWISPMAPSSRVYVTKSHLQPVDSQEPAGLFSSLPLGFMLHGEPNCYLISIASFDSAELFQLPLNGGLNTELQHGQLKTYR